MIDGFLHPALAWGALLAVVPLAIHLLTRQRHRPLEWGAMRFVLAAYKRTQRRARLEHLLLLLLRMLAVAFLALALSRPFTGERSLLAPLTESRETRVVILDASASTGYRDPAEPVFQRVLDRTRELLRELDGSRGDRAQVVLGGPTPTLLPARDPESLLGLLETISEPTDGELDLSAALDLALEALEEDGAELDGSSVQVWLLSDLQSSVFVGAQAADPNLPTSAAEPLGGDALDGSPGGEEPEADLTTRDRGLLGRLDRLAEKDWPLIVEDLGPPELTPENSGIAELALEGPPVSVGQALVVRVDVRHFGPEARLQARLVLELDGERLPSKRIDLPARGSNSARFEIRFDEPGDHVLTARLEGDRLPVDDSRSQIVHVPGPVRLTAVNGDPDGDDLTRDELGFLMAALQPPVDEGPFSEAPSPFVVNEVDAAALDPADLAEGDVVLLANVERLGTRELERLEQRVREGASLWITLGDRIEAQAFNQSFYRPDGSGLAPAELLARFGLPRDEGYLRIGEFDGEHPTLAFFEDPRWQPLLTEVPVYELFASEPLSDTRVLASIDGSGEPLFMERRFGNGRVFMWTTSLDNAWTRLPESPGSLIPLVHELLRYGARRPAPPKNLRLYQPLIAELESFPKEPRLVRPDGSRRPILGDPTERSAGYWELPAVDGLDRVGVYQVELADGDSLPFAVGFDSDEGDLRRLAPAELEGLHPNLTLFKGRTNESAGPVGVGGDGELWRPLLWLCVAFLVSETLWSAWIGRRRRFIR